MEAQKTQSKTTVAPAIIRQSSLSPAEQKRQQKNLQGTLKRLARKRPNQRCVFISYK